MTISRPNFGYSCPGLADKWNSQSKLDYRFQNLIPGLRDSDIRTLEGQFQGPILVIHAPVQLINGIYCPNCKPLIVGLVDIDIWFISVSHQSDFEWLDDHIKAS